MITDPGRQEIMFKENFKYMWQLRGITKEQYYERTGYSDTNGKVSSLGTLDGMPGENKLPAIANLMRCRIDDLFSLYPLSESEYVPDDEAEHEFDDYKERVLDFSWIKPWADEQGILLHVSIKRTSFCYDSFMNSLSIGYAHPKNIRTLLKFAYLFRKAPDDLYVRPGERPKWADNYSLEGHPVFVTKRKPRGKNREPDQKIKSHEEDKRMFVWKIEQAHKENPKPIKPRDGLINGFTTEQMQRMIQAAKPMSTPTVRSETTARNRIADRNRKINQINESKRAIIAEETGMSRERQNVLKTRLYKAKEDLLNEFYQKNQ